jgi:hypothetical protein
MNYYEELGLRPDASPDEIRQAYRGLARLLHPDQQPDESLRRLAESQMRRLNTIHDTLVEPSRRREYDAGLVRSLMVVGPESPSAARRTASFSLRDAGLVAAGIAVASLYWQLATPPRPGPRPPATEATAVSIESDGGRPRPRLTDRPAIAQRRRTQPLAAVSAAPARPAAPDLPALVVAEPPHVPIAADVTLPPVAFVPAPATSSIQPVTVDDVPRFGGTWVYVRPRLPTSQRSLYPADYVETVISEEGATLRGRYRARYDVADRPISSEVTFRFEGRAEKGGASLTWIGAGGAGGQAKLVLLSRNSMRIDWIATTLGTQLGLASGTAVLTRREKE